MSYIAFDNHKITQGRPNEIYTADNDCRSNSLFKQHTGTTPSQYRQAMSEAQAESV